MRKSQKNKGITMIALVVTIIIMLVVASVALSMALGDNGIITKAKMGGTKFLGEDAREVIETKTNLYVQDAVKKGKETTLYDFWFMYNSQELEDGSPNPNYDENFPIYLFEDSISAKFKPKSSGTYSPTTPYQTAIVIYNGYQTTVSSELVVSKNIKPAEELDEDLKQSLLESDCEIEFSDIKYINQSTTISKIVNKGNASDYLLQIKVNDAEWQNADLSQDSLSVTISENNTTVYARIMKNDSVISTKNMTFKDLEEVPAGTLVTFSSTYGVSGWRYTNNNIKILDLASYSNAAQNGSKIYIPSGTYYTTQDYINKYSGYCFYDHGKNIEYYGDSDKTIIIWDGVECSARDDNILYLTNSSSLMRNMVIDFYPRKNDRAGNAIGTHSKGSIENVYFRVHDTTKVTSYNYYSGSSGTVYPETKYRNCTFWFENLSKVSTDYMGYGNNRTGTIYYYNNLFNITPDYKTTFTNNNTSDSITQDITSGITDTNNRGVYNGTYAWPK